MSLERGLGKKKKLEDANMPTTNHLLVIGINAYANGIPTLNNAVKDAKAIEELLNKKYDFKSENIIPLYDKDATKKNILKAFDETRKKLTTKDNLIFYFSGHGELVESSQRGYWVPIEAEANDRGSYLNTIEIKDFVATCQARHILGIVDACYSGSLLRKISNPLLNKYFTKPSRRVMTSGLIEPVPDGMPNNHSPFAATLINALRYNTKPYLSTSALWQEMQEGLAANSFATAQFDTMHNAGHHGGDFFFLASDCDDIPEIETSITADAGPARVIAPAAPPSAPVQDEPEEDLLGLPLNEWKVKLKRIAALNIKRGLTKAEERIDTSSNAFNTLLLLQSRYHSVNRSVTQGLVNDQQANVTFNQIKVAFSSFLDDLESYDVV